MNENSLRHELFLLVGYLLTSAHGLYDEPHGYGPFRLLDTAGRLLEILEKHGLGDAFVARLQAEVEAERVGNSSDEEMRARLDELCVEYAAELGRRLPPEEESV